MLLIDRTQAGEYVRFADTMALAGIRTQLVTVDGAGALLLDPLRVFDGVDATQAANGYLGMLCGADPTSLEAATLARAIQNVHDAGGRLADVLVELDALARTGAEYRHARELSLRLAALSENPFGAPVWGDGTSVDTDVDCTVVHLPNLAIPGVRLC
jgi:hypothetical protein